jgi:predicted phosphodiesterase
MPTSVGLLLVCMHSPKLHNSELAYHLCLAYYDVLILGGLHELHLALDMDE